MSQAQLEAEAKSVLDPEKMVAKLISEIIALRQQVEQLVEMSKDTSETDSNNILTKQIASLEQALKDAEDNLKSTLENQKTTEMIPPIERINATIQTENNSHYGRLIRAH